MKAAVLQYVHVWSCFHLAVFFFFFTHFPKGTRKVCIEVLFLNHNWGVK